MSDNIAIPKNAIEAAKRDAAVTIYRLVEPDTRAHELTEDEVGEIARAACLAMLRAWSRMSVAPIPRFRPYKEAETLQHIILPLTQKTTNAEG
jgi:hypothetical protein